MDSGKQEQTKNMTLQQIKALNPSEYETQNDKVWEAISELSFPELLELEDYVIGKGDEEVSIGVQEVIFEKSEKIIQKMFEEMENFQKEAFRRYCTDDRDLCWDHIRNLIY